MREIKFRGQTLSGEWVYGYLFIWKRYGKRLYVIGEGVQNGSVIGNEVNPETVGQYTGLKDKNGVEIYEGDILKFECNDQDFYTSPVTWKSEMSSFVLTYPIPEDLYEGIADTEYEVIGNIYDPTS